ncbi:MAG: hypothetical protein P8019_09895 [Gammaproteobacteria bacterium]|jgi:mono/diheme cytochrome c family protein
MKLRTLLVYGFAATSLACSTAVQARHSVDKKLLERGRYLVRIGGCNDCHTAGYAESGGKTPESQWLEGNPVGFQGPWGTTYPANLRLYMQKLSLAQWLKAARKPLRPPMPWFNLRVMPDADLHAIYAFIRQLGPAGKPAPLYVAPGHNATSPYIVFVPQNLPKTASRH